MSSGFDLNITFLTSILILCSICFQETYSQKKVNCSSEERCICKQQGPFHKAYCANHSLQQIPNFTLSVNWIDLSNNKICSFNSNDLKRIRQNIIVLNLTKNCIKTLQGYPFEGFSKLQILKLDFNNGIRYTEHNFYEGVFKSLTSLQELDIKNSPASTASTDHWKFPGTIIPELVSLRILKINGLSNMTLSKKLEELQYLDISGRTGSFCSIRYVTKSFFEKLPALRHVDISHCHIRYIEKGVFSTHTNLSFLNISSNREMGFSVLPNVTDSFDTTDIKTFIFDSITCSTGVGTILKHCHLQNLYNTSLVELSGAFNRLEQFQEGVLRSLPKSLKAIKLEMNRFTPGKYLFDMNQLLGLEVLDISRQYKGLTYPTVWADPCEENADTILENECSRNIQYDHFLHNNYNNSIERKNGHFNLSKTYVTIFLPPKLNEIFMYSTLIYGKIRMFGIHGENLRKVHLHDNSFFDWEGSVLGVDNITYLDISSNHCYKVTGYFFINFHSLLTLNLSNNILGLSFADDLKGNIFQSQQKLNVLNISNNQIEYLPRNFFRHTVQMISLIIRNNKLSDFYLYVNHMRNLTFLDLTNNRISSLSQAAMNSLQQLLDNRLDALTIDLSGNVFTCSCQSLKFLKWIAKYKQTFKNLENYKCSENDFGFQFSKLDDSLEKLTRLCKSYLSIYLSTAIALTLIVCISFGVGVYKNKWTLRYILYKTKKKFHNRGNFNGNIQSTVHYEYDAYVSYCGSDRSFVLSEMHQQLENVRGLRLLIREKIFLPGESKSTSIMEGLQDSSKAICVVSKRYLTSKWRDYELNMAKVEGVKDRGSIRFVILILMPDVYNGTYPSKLADLLKQDCYLEYPENERDYEEFWEKLIQKISQDFSDL